jgi:beta-lactamase regulating signal transducer with metallopeptidase domain
MSLDSLFALNFLNLTLRWTLVLSLTIVAVLLMRRLFLRFGAAATYALWLLPPLAWLVTFLPGSLLAQSVWTGPEFLPLSNDFQSNTATATDVLFWQSETFWSGVWLLGVASCLIFRLGRNYSYIKTVQASAVAAGPDNAWAIASSTIYFSAAISLPLATGLLKPKIFLPMDFHARFSPEHQALMLAHEHAHLQALDLWALALAELFLALQWFNPLTYFARNRMQLDQEMACDARVLMRCKNSSIQSVRLSYAELLQFTVATGATDQRAASPLACRWPAQHPILERITMLKKSHVQSKHRYLATALGLSVAVTVSTLVWASNPSASLGSMQSLLANSTNESSGAEISKAALMYKVAVKHTFAGNAQAEQTMATPAIGVLPGKRGSISVQSKGSQEAQPSLGFTVVPGADAQHVALEVDSSEPISVAGSGLPASIRINLPAQPLGEQVKFEFADGSMSVIVTETTGAALMQESSGLAK